MVKRDAKGGHKGMPTLATATTGDIVSMIGHSGGGASGGGGFRALVRIADADEKYLFVHNAVFERSGEWKYGRPMHEQYDEHIQRGGQDRPTLSAVSDSDLLAFKALHVLEFLRKFTASVHFLETMSIDPKDAKIIEAIFDASGLDAADALRNGGRR